MKSYDFQCGHLQYVLCRCARVPQALEVRNLRMYDRRCARGPQAAIANYARSPFLQFRTQLVHGPYEDSMSESSSSITASLQRKGNECASDQ
jgi:hypothetical protein